MDELTTRPYQAGDAAAVAELHNILDAACGQEPGWTEPEIRDRLNTSAERWADDTRLVYSPAGQLVAMGYNSNPPDGGDRAHLSGGVHPDWRGRGLGREILAWQLDQAATAHKEIAPDAAWLAEAGSNSKDTSALRLYQAFGLAPIRYYFDMTAPVGPVEAPPLPDGLRMTTFDLDRSEQLYAAHMEAFGDYWGFQRRSYDKWVPLAIGQELFRPDLSRLVFDGDEIAAYVLSYDAVDDKVYIGQVGTRRPWRRRGLAAVMLADVLAAAAVDGRSKAELGADASSPTGAVSVYERVGFRTEATFVAHQKGL